MLKENFINNFDINPQRKDKKIMDSIQENFINDLDINLQEKDKKMLDSSMSEYATIKKSNKNFI